MNDYYISHTNWYFFLGRGMHNFKGLPLISINEWNKKDYGICQPSQTNLGYAAVKHVYDWTLFRSFDGLKRTRRIVVMSFFCKRSKRLPTEIVNSSVQAR